MQIRQQLRDRHVHEEKMPGVSTKKVPQRWHEARMRCAGGAMCRQAQGEESAEGEGQTEQHHEWISRNDKARARSEFQL